MHSKDDIANAVNTCSVLHNMLLHYDGFDRLWTEDDWLTQDPVDSDDENPDKASMRRLIPPERLQDYVLPTGVSDVPTEVESKHFELRSKLITNLMHLWDEGKVQHLRYPKARK